MRNIVSRKKKSDEEKSKVAKISDVSGKESEVAEGNIGCSVLNERYLLDKEREENELLANGLEEMQSFSIEWKSLRGMLQCSCGSPIDYLTRKVCSYVLFCAILNSRRSSKFMRSIGIELFRRASPGNELFRHLTHISPRLSA